MSAWFTTHRQQWIAEKIRSSGSINLGDLESHFGMSRGSASLDLQRFQRENPKVIVYDKSSKRYVPAVVQVDRPSP